MRPDGALGGPIAELLMPTDWGDFGLVGLVPGYLIVGTAVGSSVATLALDQSQNRLEIRSILAERSPTRMVPRRFGATGLVVGRYQPVFFGQGPVFEDVATLHEVDPTGAIMPGRSVPDPNHYYTEPYKLVFHPSWRFAYAAKGAGAARAIFTLAAAENGELSLLQEIPEPYLVFALTAPLP